MDVKSYDSVQLADFAFQFYSKGDTTYDMLIAIVKIPNQEKAYNLGFGVWDRETNELNDKIETNNGDADLILGTVGKIALEYLDRHPDIDLMATGSVEGNNFRARTRRYQMGINKHYAYLSERYEIEGFIAFKDEMGEFIGNWPEWKGDWQLFQRGTNYDAFLLRVKR